MMLFKKKEEAAAESEAQKVEQERIEAVEARRKEILSQKKRSERARQKAAARKAKEEEEARRAIWIDSTQTCTHVQDVIDSVIVTDDKRYLKIIEVVPQNFDMLSVRKQNSVGDSFGGLLNVIPYRVQLKCFSRKGDVEELIAIMRENMAGETNETCRAMQEDYLRLIRDTAHTVSSSSWNIKIRRWLTARTLMTQLPTSTVLQPCFEAVYWNAAIQSLILATPMKASILFFTRF